MENLLFFGVPKFGQNYSLNIFGLNIVTPKTIDFPFGTNGKSMILSVPILTHFRVFHMLYDQTHTQKKNINFPFGTNGKFIVLGVTVFRRFIVAW